MTKVVTESGEMVLQRTEWMQWVMTTTCSQIAIIAVMEGFDGSWEKAISRFLKGIHKNDSSIYRKEVLELLGETGISGITDKSFDKAAELILNSKE